MSKTTLKFYRGDFNSGAEKPPEEVYLQVGERTFCTSRTTLTDGSLYFAAMFSGGPWDESCSSAAKPIVIDRDGDMFVHVLRYLRTGVFPVFWSRSDGFDFALYLALYREADYFLVPNLTDWISEKKYVNAAKVSYSASQIVTIPTTGASWPFGSSTLGDVKRDYYPQWVIEPRYRCPRRIPVHDGNPKACGRACELAKVPGQSYYEDTAVVKALVCESKVHFNNKLCLEESDV